MAALALAVSASAQPESDYPAAVRHPAQQRVLREKNLAKPPNLKAFGWTLDADGVYRAVAVPAGAPAGTPRLTATAAQLAAALARWQASNGTSILSRTPG